MARVNIDDVMRVDVRWKMLATRLGLDVFSVIGRMDRVWSFCTEHQRFSLPPGMIDALTEFPGFADGLSDPSVELATLSDGVIAIPYTVGRIEWIVSNRKNGKKGGRPKKTARLPPGFQNDDKNKPSANPLSLSLSLAPALAPALVLENQERQKPKPEANGPTPDGVKAREVIASYCDAFKAQYKTSPPIGRKEAGIVLNLLKTMSAERCTDLVKKFLEMRDPYFVKKRHDLGTFATSLNAVVVYADTGFAPTNAEIRNHDKDLTNRNSFQAAREHLNRGKP